MKTSNSISALLLLFISISFINCDDSNDVGPSELLDNTSAEEGNQSPFSWFVVNGDYQSEWSELQSSEGNRSLEIISDISVGKFGYWGQSVANNIPFGQKLRLSCDIKLEEVTGAGVSIALRGDDANQKSIFFYTTQGKTLIAGSEDWKRYSVEMINAVPEEVTKIFVFLVLLTDTDGTVFFDDISLKAF